MNKAERLLKKLIKACPSLWGTNDMARQKALTHLFFINGNGYEWNGHGELFDVFESHPTVMPLKDERPGLSRRMTYEENMTPVLFPDDWRASSQYSMLGSMPDNAHPDFLKLANETVSWFIEKSCDWNFPHACPMKGVMWGISPLYRYDAIKELEAFQDKAKKRFGKLWRRAKSHQKRIVRELQKKE